MVAKCGLFSLSFNVLNCNFSYKGEGYVIRWEYSIVASRVMKMLKDIEEAKASGRHRCAYFFWLGNDCAVTEQGATAVMTVDLDEERGPHVCIPMFFDVPLLSSLLFSQWINNHFIEEDDYQT